MISLGIDIGGTGCKCVAFEQGGRQLSLAYTEYPVKSGAVTLSPELLKASVFNVIRECVDGLPEVSDIVAVTVSSFGESFVALDREGVPVGDIIMYFGASESKGFDELVERVGSEKFGRICRIMPDSSYSLSKMLYTLENSPRPIDKFLFVAGYICHALSGRAATDVSLACRSLLYDVKGGCWSEELLADCGIALSQLPELLPAGTDLGEILPEAAEQLGLPQGAHIVLGCHDQIVNALGAGVDGVADAVDTSGTCECLTPLFASVPESVDFLSNSFATVPYLSGRGYVTYAYNISAGSVIRWYRNAFASHLKEDGRSVYDVLNEGAPSEPTGLIVLPFLQGMGGTPEVDPSATGAIAGLTTKTDIYELYRAILEGITLEMRYNLEKLRESGVAVNRLFACGGGARSRLWLQIKADILNCEIIPVAIEETGAMGSAVLGFAAVTGEDPFSLVRRFRKYGETVYPNRQVGEIYEEKYKKYKKLRAVYKEI